MPPIWAQSKDINIPAAVLLLTQPYCSILQKSYQKKVESSPEGFQYDLTEARVTEKTRNNVCPICQKKTEYCGSTEY